MEQIKQTKVYTLIYTAMMVACLVILSQIQIPLVGGIPVTLQTLGVFLIAHILHTKNGTIAILIYLLLGFLGLPVFSGFGSGIQVLFGPTGGFLIGFIPLVFITSLGNKKRLYVRYFYHLIGLIICYLLGCFMYYNSYGVFFLPTFPIMFIKDLIFSFISIFLSNEIIIRINLSQ